MPTTRLDRRVGLGCGCRRARRSTSNVRGAGAVGHRGERPVVAVGESQVACAAGQDDVAGALRLWRWVMCRRRSCGCARHCIGRGQRRIRRAGVQRLHAERSDRAQDLGVGTLTEQLVGARVRDRDLVGQLGGDGDEARGRVSRSPVRRVATCVGDRGSARCGSRQREYRHCAGGRRDAMRWRSWRRAARPLGWVSAPQPRLRGNRREPGSAKVSRAAG
jgi:hypothetical protein